MNNSNPFIRKIVYIACIGALLIPLSLVSRPETRTAEGEINDAGGVLSMLREKNNLSQAKMSEIDPASETMKLASLGLRGVAVNMLWMQAMDHKKKENYDKLASTLQALTKIQPNFVKVWEYQAHNLAYNVSMEFDDYEYRYSWVKKGLAFLKQGMPFNKRDHRMPSKLGFFTGNKMGKSDEKLSFRRMFRKDNEFHQEMSTHIAPDLYDQLSYGPDSWKMAYQWYAYSRDMVEKDSCPQREPDMMFYMYRPAQLRNQGLALQEEFRSDEIIQEVWREASDEWTGYGNEEISNTQGITISLEKIADYESDIEAERRIIDELVPPGTRAEIMKDLMDEAKLTDSQKAVMAMDPAERNDEQNALARGIARFLNDNAMGLDLTIAREAKEEDRTKADRAALEIQRLLEQIRTSDKSANTINYRYWKARNRSESTQMTIAARQSLFDAREMWRKSIYDDEYDFDYKTKTKSITNQGAISLYLTAFSKWSEVLDDYPELKDGAFADQLIDAVKEYQDMLNVTNREWPDDFPLQSFVDYRAENGFADDMIPTTDDIEERRSGRQGNGDSESGGDIGDDMPAKQDLDIGDEPTDQAAPKPSATENPKADASEKAAEQAPEATLELTGPDKNSPEKKETPESKTEGTEKKK
ncbi:MAG: hypothetical protein ACPHO8_11955 [Mariniblastus sp.]